MDWSGILEDGLRSALGLLAAVYALSAIGINLQFGYTGLVNYGQAGFLLVGAYGTAIAVDRWDWPLWVAFLVGMAAAVLLGLVLGIPTLRLRADYLAIVTISAAEILRITANSRAAQDVTGGPQGIKGIAGDFFDLNPFTGRFTLFGDVAYSARNLWVITVTWSLVVVISVLLYLLVRSPWGRVLKAIREDEDAARALGKNVFAFKMQSLVIGGVIGGIAGVMLAIDRQFVEPRNFESSITFLAYAALILGGVARILGPILGSMILWFFIVASQSFLTEAIENGFLGIDGLVTRDDVGPVRFMLVGLLIMLLVIFRPQGILGDRREVMLGE
ncbi:MAG: branched-chain amino acid ABC transporter permease [Acidimicrobiia bacterium]|nr:MAG: branched-chain amino acid ABC transporter permease [Acidimicrobiia bacterium]